MKKKLVFVGLGAVGLLALLAGTAGAKEKSPSAPSAAPPSPDEDLDLRDNETLVIPPGAEGMPDGSSIPVIVREDEPLQIVPDSATHRPAPPSPVASNEPPFGDPALATLPTEEEIAAVSEETGTPQTTIVDAIVEEIVPEPPAPLAVAETTPQADPNGTVALARLMIVREGHPGWKEDLQPEISVWQERVGLKPDGKFGVLSAAKMAEEVGVLPLVRYWTAGKHWDKASALKDYKAQIGSTIASLKELLPESAAHIAALEESMKREQAQALAKNPAPVNSEAAVQKIIEGATSRTMSAYVS